MNRPFGKPGLPPNWSTARKQGVGTACNDRSKVWFTIARGIVTEVYYPTLDTANTRDLQFLVSDGNVFFEEEKLLPTGLGVFYHDFEPNTFESETTLIFTFRRKNYRLEGKEYKIFIT